MSIGHSYVHSTNGRTEMPFDIQMYIRPLGKQKCPVDIQMSIRPMDEQKCPVDIQMSIGHLAEVLDMYVISQSYFNDFALHMIRLDIKKLGLDSSGFGK